MGEGLLDFMLGYPMPPYPSEAQFVIDTFGKAPNIEDVITLLQSRIDSLKGVETLKGKAERMRFGNCRGFLPPRHYGNGSARFTRGPRQPTQTSLQKSCCPAMWSSLSTMDSLERELRRANKWDISRGYGFPLGAEEQPSSVLLLKLHGSMNWLISIFGGATHGAFQVANWPLAALGSHPVIHRADLQHLGYADFAGHTYQSGGAFPCLILPGRKKEFFYDTSFGYEFGDFWEQLWSHAADAVKRSEKIVLCGYSLLPVDKRACELLLREPRKEIQVSIVCGSQSARIANDFRAAGFSNVNVFASGYFEDWVQAEVKTI